MRQVLKKSQVQGSCHASRALNCQMPALGHKLPALGHILASFFPIKGTIQYNQIVKSITTVVWVVQNRFKICIIYESHICANMNQICVYVTL